jgi:hypothetical protein
MSCFKERFQLQEAAGCTMSSDSDEEPIFFPTKITAIPLSRLEELMCSGEDHHPELLNISKHMLKGRRLDMHNMHHFTAVPFLYRRHSRRWLDISSQST